MFRTADWLWVIWSDLIMSDHLTLYICVCVCVCVCVYIYYIYIYYIYIYVYTYIRLPLFNFFFIVRRSLLFLYVSFHQHKSLAGTNAQGILPEQNCPSFYFILKFLVLASSTLSEIKPRNILPILWAYLAYYHFWLPLSSFVGLIT